MLARPRTSARMVALFPSSERILGALPLKFL
jgi:hypothetical protein